METRGGGGGVHQLLVDESGMGLLEAVDVHTVEVKDLPEEL